MLLFNSFIVQKFPVSYDFNTSNVTIQRLNFCVWKKRQNNFNTSNVTIQLNNVCSCQVSSYISIHLMLLFNRQLYLLKSYLIDFNTSNVTIQLSQLHLLTLARSISIHLMLLFNYTEDDYNIAQDIDFNTSNVTIQRTNAKNQV